MDFARMKQNSPTPLMLVEDLVANRSGRLSNIHIQERIIRSALSNPEQQVDSIPILVETP